MIRRIRCLTLLTALVFAADLPASARAQEAAEANPQGASALTAHFQAEVARGGRPGYVLLVWRDGELAHKSAIGYANLASRTPMTLQTRFRLASMTKPIVSAAAMKLVEEGRLQLSDPVSRYIPQFAQARVSTGARSADGRPATEALKRPMTVLDLMTHTSGLGGAPSINPLAQELYLANVEAYFTRGSMAEKASLLAATPLWFQPGERFGYGIYSTDMLGRVIEVAAGAPLDRYLDEAIFKPLAMKDTGFLLAGREVPGLATMYRRGESGPSPVVDHGLDRLTAPHGGGGLYSTAPDYLRFLRMIANGGELEGIRVLAPSTVAMMTRNVLSKEMLPIGRGVTSMAGGFGLGFSVAMEDYPIGDSPLVSGDYFWAGSSDTFFFASPSRRIIGVALTQFDGSDYRGWRDFATMALAAYAYVPPKQAASFGSTSSRSPSTR